MAKAALQMHDVLANIECCDPTLMVQSNPIGRAGTHESSWQTPMLHTLFSEFKSGKIAQLLGLECLKFSDF